MGVWPFLLLIGWLIVLHCKMRVFSRQLLNIFNRATCVSSFSSRCYSSIYAANTKTADFCRRSDLRPVSRTCHHLRATICDDHQRRYSTLHRTQCDVHKFGELQLTVGSSCHVTISSLNPQIYIDQNLVIFDNTAARLSVEQHNSDGVSRVSISESNEEKTSEPSRQQCDVNIEVPIKYGSLYVIYKSDNTAVDYVCH